MQKIYRKRGLFINIEKIKYVAGSAGTAEGGDIGVDCYKYLDSTVFQGKWVMTQQNPIL